jgi:hypothetical protein
VAVSSRHHRTAPLQERDLVVQLNSLCAVMQGIQWAIKHLQSNENALFPTLLVAACEFGHERKEQRESKLAVVVQVRTDQGRKKIAMTNRPSV